MNLPTHHFNPRFRIAADLDLGKMLLFYMPNTFSKCLMKIYPWYVLRPHHWFTHAERVLLVFPCIQSHAQSFNVHTIRIIKSQQRTDWQASVLPATSSLLSTLREPPACRFSYCSNYAPILLLCVVIVDCKTRWCKRGRDNPADFGNWLTDGE